MSYFITGGTGFIGRFFIDKLQEREGDIYVLTRKGSEQKFEALQERFGGDSNRLIPVTGDLTEPSLGVDEKVINELQGKVQHFCHFAAIYDIGASLESQQAANIDGTREPIPVNNWLNGPGSRMPAPFTAPSRSGQA